MNFNIDTEYHFKTAIKEKPNPKLLVLTFWKIDFAKFEDIVSNHTVKVKWSLHYLFNFQKNNGIIHDDEIINIDLLFANFGVNIWTRNGKNHIYFDQKILLFCTVHWYLILLSLGWNNWKMNWDWVICICKQNFQLDWSNV